MITYKTMLGDDGIKSITSETKKLVNQQKDLMKTLNSMAPVLNTAKETLSGMDLPNIGEMGNLLKKLNGGAPDLKKLGKKADKKDLNNKVNIYMAKICPPGFICIENMTIIFLILVLILAVVVYYYIINKEPTTNKEVVVIKENNNSSFFQK